MEIESEHQSVLSNAMYSVPIPLIVIRGRIIQTKKTDPPENLVLLERKKIKCRNLTKENAATRIV